MRITLIPLLFSLAAILCAEDGKPAEQKRLYSVTWDLASHKLVWVVEHGSEQNGKFVAAGSDRYEISPDQATMSFANENRAFTEEEAASLHRLLDTLSIYCAESVVWWDQGKGDKVDAPPNSNGEKIRKPVTPPNALPTAAALLLARIPQ
ncbi:MAG: hypothetical protein U0Q18_22410 [Bryobacteraceae bacterium]